MTALIITDVSKFPILSSIDDFYWNPTNNTVGGVYWLQLEAQLDLDNAGIEYTIGEIEIVEPVDPLIED